MRSLSVVAALALAVGAAGCHSNPYCLNCGQAVVVSDGGPLVADLSGPMPDLTLPPVDDLAGQGCQPSNGGVEKCDGLDNDCNGVIDDVDPTKLAADPNNCGKCGNICDFNAQHQFGACSLVGGAATCQPTTCVPGYFDIDPAIPGCEYQCTPTNLADGGVAVEICDGKDNDCDGVIDDGFGAPLYNSDVNNCGACGTVCSIPGAVSKCVANPAAGNKGMCAVDHCINDPGKNTYKHDPLKGDINVTGCEYHCAVASSTAGDCNAAVNTCTFPPEICNGLDDDCNLAVDDSPTDIGAACGAKCPGGLAANCVGECKPGAIVCTNGVKTCVGGKGPVAETCNGKDDDCNNLIDDPFTKIGAAGYNGTAPLYNSDPKNCGMCGNSCNLAHTAINGCAPPPTNPTTSVGICTVVQCTTGFNYVPNQLPSGCPGTTPPRDGPSGVGCNYACDGSIPLGPEICDGKDNDCNGAIDEDRVAKPCYPQGMARPDPTVFCATAGVCAGQAALGRITASCTGGSAGWVCVYSDTIPNIQKNGSNLATFETLCDGLDNNCNGIKDLDGFPTLGSNCSAGFGPCKGAGKVACATSTTAACNATADASKATDELCNGIDDDCDGQIDESTDGPGTCANGSPHLCKGYHDPTVHENGVYVYAYEASRTDALTGSDPGGPSQGAAVGRACSRAGVLPWTGVTWSTANAACTAITNPLNGAQHGRLCTAAEWTTACEGSGGAPTAPTVKYSMSGTQTSYEGQICNDQNQSGQPCRAGSDCNSNSCDTVRHICKCTSDGNCNGGGGFTCLAGLCMSSTRAPWVTGSAGTQSVASSRTCVTDWGGSPVAPLVSQLHDMSGNVMEWTSDSTTVFGNTYFRIRGGSYSSPAGATQFDGDSCEFSFDIAQDGFIFPDVGFRCCTDFAP